MSPPDNEPPAQPKPPAAPKAPGGSTPQPGGAKAVVSPAVVRPAGVVAPRPIGTSPPAISPTKKPSVPAPGASRPSSPAITPAVPKAAPVPRIEIPTNLDGEAVAPGQTAPPPEVDVAVATLDSNENDLLALAKASIEVDVPAPRPRMGSNPDRESVPAARPRMSSIPEYDGAEPRRSRNPDSLPPRKSGEIEAPPTSRRSFEDLLPASRRGDADPDIPPPSHVDADRPPGSKDPYIGTTFDHRYKIERLLGEGGMGYVYLARHKVIDKKVAVKVLRSDMARDREILERFLQEARAASSIGNPHIIDISDFGDLPDGSTYFVMEYLDGKSLIQLTEKTKRLPPELIAKVSIQMANGLAAAHERGIIHRDLKPENVFIIQRGNDKEFVKILDFGIAKVATSGENKLTRAGAVFGTPHYMSPEQAAGAPLDHRTDIYSLGVMMYEMATGMLPFVADNFMGILSQHMYQPPKRPSELALDPPLPPGLEAIILKCLSKQSDQRYPDMEELAADLTRFQNGEVPEAVAEMMSRTGGFDVPENYFPDGRKTHVADPGPPKRTWIKYVAVGAVVMGATLGSVLYLVGGPNAGAGKPTVQPTAAVPPPAPTQGKIIVALATDPATAVGYRDGQPFKMPVSVEIEPGKPVVFEIKAEGYEAQTVKLDGSEPSKTVKLTPLPSATATTVPSDSPTLRPWPKSSGVPSTKKSNSKSGGDVVDPWGGKGN